MNLARLVPPKPARRHVIERIRYRDEAIWCSCGALVNADPDLVVYDRHEPLTLAWADHRREAGERVLSVAQAAMNHRGFS